MLRMGMVIGTVNILTFFLQFVFLHQSQHRNVTLTNLFNCNYIFPLSLSSRAALSECEIKNVQALKIFFVLCMGKSFSPVRAR